MKIIVKPIYIFLQKLVYIILKLLVGLKVVGRENLPHSKAFIIASNHYSYLDPPAIGCVAPYTIHFAAKKELFKGKFLNWFFHEVHAIPVNRQGVDRTLLRNLARLIKEKKGFLIFPEGTRAKTEEFLSPKFGLGMIAYGKNVEIIPTYISSFGKISDFIWRRKKLVLYFGKPINSLDIPIDNELKNKEKYKILTTYIMEKIYELKTQHNKG